MDRWKFSSKNIVPELLNWYEVYQTGGEQELVSIGKIKQNVWSHGGRYNWKTIY